MAYARLIRTHSCRSCRVCPSCRICLYDELYTFAAKDEYCRECGRWTVAALGSDPMSPAYQQAEV